MNGGPTLPTSSRRRRSAGTAEGRTLGNQSPALGAVGSTLHTHQLFCCGLSGERGLTDAIVALAHGLVHGLLEFHGLEYLPDAHGPGACPVDHHGPVPAFE